ncbi:MAG TPA: hypothetical protein VLJ14_12430 [Ktedonobacterales bacterium]|nr:hypothetical protein [Ktedonobacterales bacterium]
MLRSTLPFLPFFASASPGVLSLTWNSSGFAGIGNVTFRVMGGKSGKKRQDRGKNGKVCGNEFAVFGAGGKR